MTAHVGRDFREVSYDHGCVTLDGSLVKRGRTSNPAFVAAPALEAVIGRPRDFQLQTVCVAADQFANGPVGQGTALTLAVALGVYRGAE